MSNGVTYVAVGTPQANPTVEREFQRFMHGPVWPVFTRLASNADSADDRLVEYLLQLPEAVATFGTMPLGVFVFACTGSSYLVGLEREQDIVESVERRHHLQVVTATQAIRRELEGRGAQRIALLAPYPKKLTDAAIDYWQKLGFEIVRSARIDVGPDTRSIYDLVDDDVASALRSFDPGNADVILLSGTGMPTAQTLRQYEGSAISSNLCLATEALRRVQHWPAKQAADIHRLLAASG